MSGEKKIRRGGEMRSKTRERNKRKGNTQKWVEKDLQGWKKLKKKEEK